MIGINYRKIILFVLTFLFLGVAASDVKLVSAASTDDFVITVQIDNPGDTFTIPTTGTGYNYNVDCNNDSVDDWTAQTGENRLHSAYRPYSATGV